MHIACMKLLNYVPILTDVKKHPALQRDFLVSIVCNNAISCYFNNEGGVSLKIRIEMCINQLTTDLASWLW